MSLISSLADLRLPDLPRMWIQQAPTPRSSAASRMYVDATDASSTHSSRPLVSTITTMATSEDASGPAPMALHSATLLMTSLSRRTTNSTGWPPHDDGARSADSSM